MAIYTYDCRHSLNQLGNSYVLDNFINALEELNISFPRDSASGDALGAFWVPLSQNPETGTRWTARNGYDSMPRSNMHILTGQHVTKILAGNKTDGEVGIIGVEVGLMVPQTDTT